MKPLSLSVCCFLIFLLACKTTTNITTDKETKLANPSHSTLEQELQELLKWFPGEYDNHQQVYQEAVQKIAQEKRHRQTHHIFFPVQIKGIPGQQLYAQQSQHYDLDNIYRQRIYSFKVDDLEQAIQLTIYTPKEPLQLKNVHLQPTLFDTFSKEDFFLKPGCEVYWKKTDNQFEGYLKENACSYFSKRFNKRVFLNETLILKPDALLLDDKGVDSLGNLVFGVDDKGPTINRKIPPCE